MYRTPSLSSATLSFTTTFRRLRTGDADDEGDHDLPLDVERELVGAHMEPAPEPR